MAGVHTIYLSDSSLVEYGETSVNTKIQMKTIDTLESSGMKVIYERRDFTPGLSIHDSKREATQSSDVVVVILSDNYIETPNCMYDVALAVCYQRPIIIVDKRRTHRNMPPLLTIANFPKINGRKSSKKVLQKLIARISHYLKDTSVEDQKTTKELTDKGLAFVRDVEREAGIDNEKSLHERIKQLQRQIDGLLEEKRVLNYISISGAEIDFKGFHSERRLRIEAERKYRELRNKTRELEGYLSKIHNDGNPSTSQTASTNQIKQHIQDQINQIVINKLQHNVRNEIDNGDRIPSELRCFCQKYEKMIGPNIRHFGQLLNLTDEQIDKVDEYQKYGFTEMFWQTIRLWRPNMNGHGAFLTFLNALEGIEVDIGGKPMPQAEVKVLHEKAPFILKNYYHLARLVLYLLSNHVLSDVTVMYIMEPKQDEERLLRLLDVLTTKQNGIQAICDALIDTDHEFIANKILEDLPNLERCQGPVEISGESSDAAGVYSSDDSKCMVAIVPPMNVRRIVAPKPVAVESCWDACDDSIGLIKENKLQQIQHPKINQNSKRNQSSCTIQ